MKTLCNALAGVCLAAFALCAQTATCNTATPAICSAPDGNGVVQIKPQAVPTSSTAVTTYDAYLHTITIANTTSGALTFTLADRQASPVSAMSAVSIAANRTYVIVFPNGYWCPGGFTVIASGSGLTWYGRWAQ
jgi:hypothetical protein